MSDTPDLAQRLDADALKCGDCGRRFFCNRCPECAGNYRDARAEGYKQDAAALRAALARQALDLGAETEAEKFRHTETRSSLDGCTQKVVQLAAALAAKTEQQQAIEQHRLAREREIEELRAALAEAQAERDALKAEVVRQWALAERSRL